MRMLIHMPRWLRNMILLSGDALTLGLAPLISLFLRFEGPPPAEYVGFRWELSALRVCLGLFVLARMGLYRPLWRYAGLEETSRTVWASAVVTLLFLGEVVWTFHLQFPRSVVLVTWLLTIAGLAVLRLSARLLRSRMGPRTKANLREKRTLIIGAGDAGAMVASELTKHPELGSLPVGFIDDDRSKLGLSIQGVEVLGSRSDLERTVREQRVSEIIVAMPSARGSVIRDIVSATSSMDVTLKMVPGVYELLDGKLSMGSIRNVKPEDLLNRPPADMDLESIASYLRGAVILITGAAGSIGSELARQVSRFQPSVLNLADIDESSLYNLQNELKWRYPEVHTQPVLLNIRESDEVERVFRRCTPHVVFHASALKHVPLTEQQPSEAVKTNVLGTINVARAAVAVGTRHFVLISTDKAVNPTSILGATKRVSEYVGQALSGRQTIFMAVRFGNVLGSRGSVVPLFLAQIERGGPVTVTHPAMTRFFMTIPEAAQLVIQAGAFGRGGEVFVLDMGEAVKIVDLAQNLIRLSGHGREDEIEIQFTGVRPGERLYEEVLLAEEGVTATRHQRIFVTRSAGMPFPQGQFWHHVRNLAQAAEKCDDERVRAILHELVPPYKEVDIPPVEQIAAATDLA